MSGKNRNYTIEDLERIIEGVTANEARKKRLGQDLDDVVDDLIDTIKNPKMKKKRQKKVKLRRTGSNSPVQGCEIMQSCYAPMRGGGGYCGGGSRC